MAHLEVACRRFALLSGITQEASNYATCIHPWGAAGQRRGMLALVTEPAGDHPALSVEACRLVHDVLIQQYYADNSLGLTSGLLKAIDSANSALLEYNYNNEIAHIEAGQNGPVAVRAGGVRTRRSRVGLTAILLRPDGEGVYLAQMSPTQAYILHNGQVSALPEPVSWQNRPGKLAVTLRRVPDHPDAETDEGNNDHGEDDADNLPPVTPPSIPLGSGPVVEADLLYRRVEPGDLVVVVSTSLARHLSRGLAEELFLHGGADEIRESLYTLATERGLAQSHACVLHLGVQETSGVDTDLAALVTPSQTENLVANGALHLLHPTPAPHPEPQPQQPPVKLDPLKTPRQWLMKLKATEVAAPQPPPKEVTDTTDPLQPVQPNTSEAEPDVWIWNAHPTPKLAFDQSEGTTSYQPTQVLLQRSLEVPPYKAAKTRDPGDSDHDEQAELEFDGWEDAPPALDSIRKDLNRSHGSVDGNTARKHVEEHTVPHYSRSGQATTARPNIYPVPTLFDAADDYEDEPLLFRTPDFLRQEPSNSATPLSQRAIAWARNVLPTGAFSRGSIQVGGRPITLPPVRLLIAVALVLILGMLILSVFNMARSPKQGQVNQFLAQAQQEDLLANQPSALPSERQAHLTKVLDLANQALKADPTSKDAALLVQKTEASLDALQGITRLQPKLLFDLNSSSNASTGDPQSSTQALTNTITNTQHRSTLIVQSNDAYVLDSERGGIYRCRIAARDCAVILKEGDDASGQKVGALLGMTFRVGNLVALDKDLASFVFNADTSAWQPQQLGGADGLDKPKDIGNYDGNLYLLAAKPAQISKYSAGRYDQPPTDWIKDPPSLDQMKNPVSMSIDGSIYVLLSDGSILAMEGGKVVRTIQAKASDGNPPTQIFTSADAQDLYLLNPTAGSVTRLTKEGQARATLKPGKASGVTSISAISVDEGSNKLYILASRKVYEASLHAPAPGAAVPGNPSQPAPRPTVAP